VALSRALLSRLSGVIVRSQTLRSATVRPSMRFCVRFVWGPAKRLKRICADDEALLAHISICLAIICIASVGVVCEWCGSYSALDKHLWTVGIAYLVWIDIRNGLIIGCASQIFVCAILGVRSTLCSRAVRRSCDSAGW